MSVEKLLSALGKEADLKEKTVLEEAREKARSILSEAVEKARDLDVRISALKKAVELKRQSLLLSHQKLRDRERATLTQNLIISDIFSECAALHRRFMESPAYADFLKDEYRRILEEMGTVEEVRADPKTAALLIGMGISPVVADDKIEGGFAAVTEKGTRKISCVFPHRLQKKWREAAPRFVKRIVEATEL